MTESKRVDDKGRAYAGSQMQIQIYVARREAELTASVVTALNAHGSPIPGIRWVSPIESSGFAEQIDGAFLDVLGHSDERPKLSAFWPKGGPHWDGLGVVEPGTGVLLVEAKSYPDEIIGPGTGAGGDSRELITESIEKAKTWACATPEADWLGPLYQYGNRIAHVYFFREVVGIDAWLVNLCFVDDPHNPTSIQQWQKELPEIKKRLGFAEGRIPFTVDVFLPACERKELVVEE